MNKIKSIIILLTLMVSGLAIVPAPAAVAAPLDVFKSACELEDNQDSELCKSRNKKLFGPDSFWTKIVNTMIYVSGAVAVIMVVVGGIRYGLSAGDASAVNSAKNTILYAIVGLVIAAMSFAIVNFVLSRI